MAVDIKEFYLKTRSLIQKHTAFTSNVISKTIIINKEQQEGTLLTKKSHKI